MTFDPFKMSEGLLDDVDVWIDEFRFEFNPDYNNGETLVGVAVISSDDDDVESGTELMFSCGDGWTTNDGGNTAEREDGKDKTFNARSAMGMFAAGAIGVAEDVMRGRYDSDGTTPMMAAMYVGLGFHLEIQEVDYGGEIGKRGRLVPTAFLGEKGKTSGKATGAAKKATGAAKAGGATKKASGVTKKKAAPADEGGVPADVKARLDGIADECENHDEFMERAMSELDPDVITPEVEAAIADAEDGSIWDEAVKRYEAAQ